MPIRWLVALAGTAVAIVLLFSFKTPQSGALAGTPVRGGSSATQAPSPSAAPSRSASSGASGPTPSPTARAAVYRDGSFTGQDYTNLFGDVQVQVIVSGGRITDVKALQLPFDRARSQEISQIAGPMLRQQALQAQSAQIDGVSGATYTSYGYYESLQSALDKSHV